MKKKKMVLIIILFLITVIFSILLVFKEKNYIKDEVVVQTNERDDTKVQVEIVNDYINIREDNDSSSNSLGKVYKGEIYTVLEKVEDEYYTWCLIETNNGIKGYIAVKYLEEGYANFLEVIE